MADSSWTVEQSRQLYSIANWSEGYFDISAQGEVAAFPLADKAGPYVSLPQLAAELTATGLSLPVLVRFSDILRQRVATLHQAFAQAIQAYDYQAEYVSVYPIKVNQQRHVVAEILDQQALKVGLEAGSKPELMAVLALAPPNGGVVVCNGYKDREYIRLALIGLALGLQTYLVVEKSHEIGLILQQAQMLGIQPRLGVRVRLASIGAGKWQNTGGEKGKFGLSSTQVLEVIEQLRQADKLDCLHLMHFHVGSQVANIRDFQGALREAARLYSQLRALGAPIDTVDVGGGLGVDYEGAHTRTDCSMNYTIAEYANNVVRAFSEICHAQNLPAPRIFTESGRAMTAHHAVLITHVTDVEPAPGSQAMPKPETAQPAVIEALWHNLHQVQRTTAVEIYHDITYWLHEAYGEFTRGSLSLAQRALAEQLYFAACRAIRDQLTPSARPQRELLDALNEKLADKYFINLSLFQSIPDAWAIDQIFPILPLTRLNEAPTRRAVLQDLTCDSDGALHQYVDHSGLETSLPVHSLHPEQPYLLGIFLGFIHPNGLLTRIAKRVARLYLP